MIRPLTTDERTVLMQYLHEEFPEQVCLVMLSLPRADADWYFVYVNGKIQGVLVL